MADGLATAEESTMQEATVEGRIERILDVKTWERRVLTGRYGRAVL